MYKELILELLQGNEWVKIQPPCPVSEIDQAVGYQAKQNEKQSVKVRRLKQ